MYQIMRKGSLGHILTSQARSVYTFMQSYLIRTFDVPIHNHWILLNILVKRKEFYQLVELTDLDLYSPYNLEGTISSWCVSCL